MSPSNSSSRNNRLAAKDRVEQMRRAQRAKQRRRSVLIWGGTAVAVLVIAFAVGLTITSEQANKPSLEAVKSYKVAQGHVTTPVTYAQTPPVGGEHAPAWLNCGIYDKPVANENAVHSLEHGAVWVTYRPGLSQAQVDLLRKAMPDTYTILSPFPGLNSPVVASAWGKQLALTGPADKRLPEFIRTYRQGPQTPEPGAACTGGTGTPSSTGAGS